MSRTSIAALGVSLAMLVAAPAWAGPGCGMKKQHYTEAGTEPRRSGVVAGADAAAAPGAGAVALNHASGADPALLALPAMRDPADGETAPPR